MRRALADDDVARLARSAERLARLAQAISARAEPGPPRASEPFTVAHGAEAAALSDADAQELVDSARDAIRAHCNQPDFGAPALFQSRPWVLMLELFIAGKCAIDVPVKVACSTLGGAATTALRSILDLERLGLVASVADDRDARRRLLKLTPQAEATLRAHLSQLVRPSGRPIRLAVRIEKQSCAEHGIVHAGRCDSVMIAPDPARSNCERETVSQ